MDFAVLDGEPECAKRLLLLSANFESDAYEQPGMSNSCMRSEDVGNLLKLRPFPQNQQNVVVHDELANRMSLFYAHSTPMTKSLIDSALMLVNSVSFCYFYLPVAISLTRRVPGLMCGCFGVVEQEHPC